MALTWRRAIFRQSNDTLKAKSCAGTAPCRPEVVGQPESAQNGVTASFSGAPQNQTPRKSGENRDEMRGQMGKAQFS